MHCPVLGLKYIFVLQVKHKLIFDGKQDKHPGPQGRHELFFNI
jgi:hypothetical protein